MYHNQTFEEGNNSAPATNYLPKTSRAQVNVRLFNEWLSDYDFEYLNNRFKQNVWHEYLEYIDKL